MAISMTKWVDITSGALPAGASDRELILRVITSNSNTSIEPDVVYDMTTLADVLATFGEDSEEYKIATKYFSFVSLTSTKPEKISFWRPMPQSSFDTTSGEAIGYCVVNSYSPKTVTVSGETRNEPDPSTKKANFMTCKQWAAMYNSQSYNKTTGEYTTTGMFWNPPSLVDSVTYKPAATMIETLDKMVDSSDNFATFIFVNSLPILDRNAATGSDDTAWPNSANAVAAWTAAQNYKFRFVQPVDIARIANQTGVMTWTQISGTDGKIDGPGSAIEYLNRIKQTCVTAVLDDYFVNLGSTGQSLGSTHPEWLTCALLASTKYSRTNSTIIQEFKALNTSNMLVTCSTDSLCQILCDLNVNFYGQTQKAGQLLAFYMEGFNLDGTDTAICDNEIWLKDRITSEVFNRFVKCNKVPAGLIGNAMINAAISGVIADGRNNLAIQPGKAISEADKAAIIQNTGAQDAPAQIYNNGYYLYVTDGETKVTNNAKHRVIDYILYYSSGEGVRKVTGSHVMV